MRSKKFSPAIHGWLVLDKPLGLTSTQALGRARRLMGGNKAGHGGTLDPLATGILPLAFGEATKVIPYIMVSDKEYEFTIRWGEARSTDDAEGSVTAKSDSRPDEAQIRAALLAFIGNVQQKPPAFSAIKVQGERAYDLARAGENVELAAREVTIHDFQLIEIIDRDSAKFRVSCGKGMYVRSLARDLAEELGTCGYVSALRRTKTGPFTLENAISIEKLEGLSKENAALTALLPIKSALGDVSVLNLLPNEANSLRLGQKILIRPQNIDFMQMPVILAEYDGVPLALVEAKNGSFSVLRGFHF